MPNHEYLTVSEIVGEAHTRHGLDVSPRVISDLFYQRKLDAGRCPIVGGRRLIPREYVEVILGVLPGLLQRGGNHQRND